MDEQRKYDDGTPKSRDTASTMEAPKVEGSELRSWRSWKVRRREPVGGVVEEEQPPALGMGM